MKTVSTPLICHCWSLLSVTITESVVTTWIHCFYSLPRLTGRVALDLQELPSRAFCTSPKTVTLNHSFVSLCQKNPPIGPFIPRADNNLGPDTLFPNVFPVLPSVSVGPSPGRGRPLHISSCSEGLQPQTCVACSLSPHITPV